jgi:hypothetical protein
VKEQSRADGWLGSRAGGVDGHGFYRRRALVGWLVGGSRHHSTAETAGRHEERRESLIPKSIKT